LTKARASMLRVFNKHTSSFLPFFPTAKSFVDTILSGKH